MTTKGVALVSSSRFSAFCVVSTLINAGLASWLLIVVAVGGVSNSAFIGKISLFLLNVGQFAKSSFSIEH